MKRQDDRARAAIDKLAAMPRGTWKSVRERYPKDVRDFVDMVATNGILFSDIMALTAARYRAVEILWEQAVQERTEEMERNGGKIPNGSTVPGANTLSIYDHSMRQALSAMHALAKDMGPQGGVGDVPVRTPDGYDLESVRRRKAERAAARLSGESARNEILQ